MLRSQQVDGMKTIPLSKGKVALVDDQDFEWLSQWPWAALKSKRRWVTPVWYATRHSTWKGPTKYMHREIAIRAGMPNARYYDHKDGNGLNNQRSNIRPCSQTQNNGNQSKRPGCTSRFKGVSWFWRTRKWVVRLKHKGKVYCLGYYHDEQEAAKVYDSAARVHFGEFAKLNLQ